MKRLYKLDNIKCILITLVIVGHLLESWQITPAEVMYKVIYTFHMPAFVFVTGYLAKWNAPKIVRRLLVPYVILQPIYILYDYYVLHRADELTLQWTQPYWLLWYLLACVFWYILIPFIDTDKIATQLLILAGAVAIALLIGYDKQVGYFLTLSRTIVFAPFFITGFYCRKNGWLCRICGMKDSGNRTIESKAGDSAEKQRAGVSEKNDDARGRASLVITMAVAAVIALGGTYLLVRMGVSRATLYESLRYEKTATGPLVRAVHMAVAAAWTVLLVLLVPNKRLPGISKAGEKSFWLYVLHGFIVRL